MIGVLAMASTAAAHVPVIWLAGPTNYCEVLAGTVGNDFVMLEPGEYEGPCRFDANLSDVPVELTTLQSLDPTNPAVFVGTSGDVVLELGGERVILLAVTFRGLPVGVDAVRFDAPREGWVRQVVFEDVAGTAVRGLGGELHVVGSTFLGVGTAVQLDCATAPCLPIAELGDNLVSGAGLAVGVGAGANVRVHDDVYAADVGVRSAGDVSADGVLVDATTVGLDLGAGPAVVSASVVRAPIALRTGPAPEPVVLLGDTLLGELVLPGWDARGRLVGSALDRSPPDLGAADVSGTVVCGADCFTDAEALDVYPVSGGPLIGAGVDDPAARADWCGFPRQDPPTAGAFEYVGPGSYGPLALGPKRGFPCVLPPSPLDSGVDHSAAPAPTHTGRPPTEPPVVAPPSESGCACASRAALAPGAPPAGFAALVCVGVRRRSRRLDRLPALR